MDDYTKKVKLRAYLVKVAGYHISLHFNPSNKFKRVLGRAYYTHSAIEIMKPCFNYTLASMKCCLLHEIAHVYQYEKTGKTGHNKGFMEMKQNLMNKYADEEMKISNTAKSKQYSEYIEDTKRKN